MSIYTLGLWHAKTDEEGSFVTAWHDMARATKAQFPEASAVLLRDRADPSLFVSFGPWPSLERISEWRESIPFTSGVAEMRRYLESFEPHTMDGTLRIE